MTSLKTILNAVWKIGVGIIALIALGITIFIAHVLYDKNYGRDYINDQDLSDNIQVVSFGDNSVRVLDSKTNKYTTPKLEWVSDLPLRDSITVYCKKGYRGFLDCITGKITIDSKRAKYRRAWQFSEGLAFVVPDKSDSLSVINHKGDIVFHNIAMYTPGCEYVFENGVCLIKDNGRYGLISKDGTWAVEPKYSEIETPNTFGYRIARGEDGYWLFDPSLNLVFTEPYDNMKYAIGRDLGEGNLYLTRNHVKQLVNYDGSVVEPFVVDLTSDLMYMIRFNEIDPNEYMIDFDVLAYYVDGYWGLMNKHTGRAITPAIYDKVEMISKDLIRAELSSNYDSESVIMDRRGIIVKQ